MGFADIRKSAQELDSFVNQVLQQTRQNKVDIIGHSQGGMMPHLFIRDLGGASKVNKFIALAPSNNGTAGLGSFTTRLGLQTQFLNSFCEACTQQQFDSPFMQELRTRPLTVPSVNYTVLYTKFDKIVTPPEQQMLPAAPNVHNILLQDLCPGRPVGHVYLSFDESSLTIVRNILNDRNDNVPCNPLREPNADF
jgi:triacylglycerol esterase/lipase EstA (alpha/beta hydrolase family)